MTTLSGSDDESQRDDFAFDGHQADVLSLALAVAERGTRARLLDADNNVMGWERIERAVLAGAPFMVGVAPHILPCDFDSAEELRRLPEVRALLNDRGLKYVEIASGRPGNRHLFIVVRPADRESLQARIVQIAGGEVPRRDIRPPLAPHRLGLPVSLVAPCSVDAALAMLRESGDQSDRLTDHTWRRLREGDPRGRYETGSELEMAILTGMVNKGWPFQRALRALLDPRNKGGAKSQGIAREKGEKAAKDYVARNFAKVEKFVGDRPAFADRKEVIAALCSQRMRVQDAIWSGSAGQKEQQVMLALIDMAVVYGSVYVHPGLRHLSEVVGLAENTVNDVLKVLVKEGWLRKYPATRGKQTTYKVNTNKRPTEWSSLEALPTSPRGGCERSASELDPNHDAFQHGAGLGPPGHTLLSYLGEPRTIAEMVANTGLPKTSVIRLLKVMKTSGLVDQTDSNYQAVSGLKRTLLLGVHARTNNVLLAGQRRRAGNQRDRERRNAGRADPGTLEAPGWAQEPQPGRGLLQPMSGDFQRLSRLQGGSAGLGVGKVGEITPTIPYRGYWISVQGGREVVWVTTEDERSRAYTAHDSSACAFGSSVLTGCVEGTAQPEP